MTNKPKFRVSLKPISNYNIVSIRQIYYEYGGRKFGDNKYRSLFSKVITRYFDLLGDKLIRLGKVSIPHIGDMILYVGQYNVSVTLRCNSTVPFHSWSFRPSDTFARKAFKWYDLERASLARKCDFKEKYFNIKKRNYYYDGKRMDYTKRYFLRAKTK